MPATAVNGRVRFANTVNIRPSADTAELERLQGERVCLSAGYFTDIEIQKLKSRA